MKTKCLLSIVGLFLLASTSLTFGQSFSSDRPGAGDGVATVEPRYFQVEAGLDFSKTNAGELNEFTSNSLPLILLRYGLTENIELRLTESFVIQDMPNFSAVQQSSGLSNLTLGGKFKLCERPEWGTQAGVLAEVVVPTGSAEVAGDALGLSLRFLHSWNFSERGNLGSNIGVYWFEEQDLSLLYSFTVGYALTDKFGVFVEPYGNYFQFDDFNLSIDGGFTYLLKQNLQLDLSAGTGISDDHFFFGLGFSWLIGKI
jgi:hypothetical protein